MGRPKNEKQPARLTVTLHENDYSKVCHLAEENDVSAAWIIRRAVQQYLGQTLPSDNNAAGSKQPRGR